MKKMAAIDFTNAIDKFHEENIFSKYELIDVMSKRGYCSLRNKLCNLIDSFIYPLEIDNYNHEETEWRDFSTIVVNTLAEMCKEYNKFEEIPKEDLLAMKEELLKQLDAGTVR